MTVWNESTFTDFINSSIEIKDDNKTACNNSIFLSQFAGSNKKGYGSKIFKI